jgi:hypothetical protein
MTAHKALASRLDAAIKGLLDHQWSHCRPAMLALVIVSFGKGFDQGPRG